LYRGGGQRGIRLRPYTTSMSTWIRRRRPQFKYIRRPRAAIYGDFRV